MARFVALLRAINVGGHTVKMDRLKTLFEELRLDEVETFIASGNVLFDTRASAAVLTPRIEAHLERALGFEVKTFLRSAGDLITIAEREPFGGAPLGPDERAYVGFLERAPEADAAKKLEKLENANNRFALIGSEMHWWSREKMSDSKLSGAVFEKTLGMAATFRNRTTVMKLAAKLSADTSAVKAKSTAARQRPR